MALTFLSILPIPHSFWKGEERMEKALFWFPLVGAILGSISYISFSVFSKFLPKSPSFLLALFFYHLLNGGLHLDGLADFSDAFFGAKKEKERFRKILKDSHIGVMGVVALIFYFFSIYSLTEHLNLSFSLFIAFGMSGRMAIVICATKSRALFDDGLGKVFIEKSGVKELFVASFTYFAVMGLLGESFFLLAIFIFTLSFLFKSLIIKHFGGFSGDIFGAFCCITEIFTFFILAGIK